MRSFLQACVRNMPAVNSLLVAVLLVGIGSAYLMRRESFPEFRLEYVIVSVLYPGASPAEIEEGICQKIEEAVRVVDGIKRIYSVAEENQGIVIVELRADVDDVQAALNEVRSEVDRIPSFPVEAEDPQIKQLTLTQPAIRVAVLGEDDSDLQSERKLREMAESVRDELLQLPSVTKVELLAAKEFQIDVEISETNLRQYGLALTQVANVLRQQNLELPAGNIRTDVGELLVRSKNKYHSGAEIARLPILTDPSGVVLTVGDLGTVHDGFVDTTTINRVDGQPGLVLLVQKSAREDLLQIVAEVNQYVAEKSLPNGFRLRTFGDESRMVRDRLELLIRNGISGLVLVFFLLSLFLEIRVAFWVAASIPISIFGACAVMYAAGDTLNMISMFGILMALGMVVDDAVVVSENIFRQRQQGRPAEEAAVEGCLEVAPSVANAVLTTVVAFLPLFFISGVLGKFIAIMPLAVVAMLGVSLAESVISLPGHLAHCRSGAIDWTLRVRRWFQVRYLGPAERAAGPIFAPVLRAPLVLLLLALLLALTPIERLARALEWLRAHFGLWLQKVIDHFYTPLLRWTLGHTAITVACCLALLMLAGGLVAGGITPYVVFPKLDDEVIRAVIVYPDGTPGAVTDEATQRLEQASRRMADEFAAQGRPVLQTTYRSVGEVTSDDPMGGDRGSHVGSVLLELVPADERGVRSRDIIARWRELAGEFPGAERLSFAGMVFGPGGKPIEFRLVGKDFADIDDAAERIKDRLRLYPGVFDVHDDYNPGKWEWQLKIKPLAESMGIQLADLADTVRSSYYGAEVMRLQRGRHEVKLMVRYPHDERRSLANFEEIRVRRPDGAEVPLSELAEVEVVRGVSEIHRVNQFRSITITADVDEATANTHAIVGSLRRDFVPAVLREHPNLSILWEGQQQETQESVQSLMRGFIVAAFGIFVLLTLEFRSYGQPLIVMAVIPFGLVGAVLGHLVLGLPITMFSLFGIVALAGIVVNDAIVLIDLVNRLCVEGMPLRQALVEAGRRRFRPILLTSVTTVGGLTPLLLESSFQAQVLIPMAASISFGLMLSTVWVLLLVPTLYQVHARWTGVFARRAPAAAAALQPRTPLG